MRSWPRPTGCSNAPAPNKDEVATYQTSGIVIRRFNLGEADRIITLLTPDHGKLRAVARGVRKIKSKLAGHLELFSDSKLMLARGRNLDVLTSARLDHYFDLTHDYELLSQAYLMAEMLDKLVAENVPSAGIYELAQKSLGMLELGEAWHLPELYFKANLLSQLGYSPSLTTCSTCHLALGGETNYVFNAEQGGVLHTRCAQGWEPALSGTELALWRQMGFLEPERTSADVGQKSLAVVLKLIDQLYAQLFNQRFHATALLDVK